MKHPCKHCDQSFDTGKSLGGHMRSHLAIMKQKPDVNHQKIDEFDMGFDCNGQSSYGLRENPKKSCKVFDKEGKGLEQSSVCEQCGRGFKSCKALFGHMRLHSSGSAGKGKAKAEFEVQSEYVIPSPVRKKRSQRRYEINPSCSVSNLNESCSGLDDCDDKEELKEIAMCLLMLSKGRFYSGPESCDISSKNLQPELGITNAQMNDLDGIDVGSDDHDHDHDHGSGIALFGKKDGEFFDSGSEFMSNDHNMVEFSFDFDASPKYCKSKKPKLGVELDLHLGHSEILVKTPTSRLDHSFDLNKTPGTDKSVQLLEKLEREKDADGGICESVTEGNLVMKNHSTDFEVCDQPEMEHEFRCKICSKVFGSRKALVGHGLHCPTYKKRHGKKQANQSSSIVAAERCHQINMVEKEGSEKAEASNDKLKQLRNHECSICSKAFQSGWALGGHMRAHFVSNDNVDKVDGCEADPVGDISVVDRCEAGPAADDFSSGSDRVESKLCWFGVVGVVSH